MSASSYRIVNGETHIETMLPHGNSASKLRASEPDDDLASLPSYRRYMSSTTRRTITRGDDVQAVNSEWKCEMGVILLRQIGNWVVLVCSLLVKDHGCGGRRECKDPLSPFSRLNA